MGCARTDSILSGDGSALSSDIGRPNPPLTVPEDGPMKPRSTATPRSGEKPLNGGARATNAAGATARCEHLPGHARVHPVASSSASWL
jgi:hypothetical protein